MRRTVFSGLGAAAGAMLTALALCHAAAAQPAASLPEPGPAVDVLRQGQQLESDRRWGEALSLYEEAVRQYPGDATIRERFDLARMHYDLGRRYGDRSFLEMIGRLASEESLDLYGEVLLKIQSHYVESPNWRFLVDRGTGSFELALSEPSFMNCHLAGVDAATIDGFRGELRRRMAPLMIQTSSGARAAVAMAAGLAAERLGLAPAAVVLEYTCGASNGLDLYSAYLTPGQLAEVYSQIDGNFVGLGIELKAANGALLIVRVIPGSPAHVAGILAGDRILSVDGQSTRPLTTEQAADLLQGEIGTSAWLVLETPGQPSRQIAVRRTHIEVPSIEGSAILDAAHGIAYLKLTCFQKSTTRDLDAALWSLHRQGMRSLLVDLRGNPGGLLVTAVEVVDKFIERGVIVSTHGRSSGEDFTYAAHSGGTWGVPLVVLIDKDSASAAEIFAGAIRDHRRGTIVGERSFGKGSVQGIFPLNTGGAGIRLTTAKFYSPSGHPYSGSGVEPDLLMHRVARPTFDAVSMPQRGGEDPMLSAALQVARQQLVAQR